MSTRDFADANPPTPGGELWHGPPAPGHRGACLRGTDDTEAVMKFLFDDESFSFEALRTAGFALAR